MRRTSQVLVAASESHETICRCTLVFLGSSLGESPKAQSVIGGKNTSTCSTGYQCGVIVHEPAIGTHGSATPFHVRLAAFRTSPIPQVRMTEATLHFAGKMAAKIPPYFGAVDAELESSTWYPRRASDDWPSTSVARKTRLSVREAPGRRKMWPEVHNLVSKYM